MYRGNMKKAQSIRHLDTYWNMTFSFCWTCLFRWQLHFAVRLVSRLCWFQTNLWPMLWGGAETGRMMRVEYWFIFTHLRVVQSTPQKMPICTQLYVNTSHTHWNYMYAHLHFVHVYIFTYAYTCIYFFSFWFDFCFFTHCLICFHFFDTHIYIYIKCIFWFIYTCFFIIWFFHLHILKEKRQQENRSEPEMVFVGWWSQKKKHATTGGGSRGWILWIPGASASGFTGNWKIGNT